MKAALLILVLMCTALSTVGVHRSHAQVEEEAMVYRKSGAKAFGLSVLVPGLGHRYVNGGRWGGAGTVFVSAEVSLWLALAATIVQENNYIDGYESLVATRAGNTLNGKGRAFELAVGTYDSSDEYLDALLRARQWDRLEYAQDPDNQWEWSAASDRERYTTLRNDADEAGRRKSALIGALVVNRIVSGITAALSARKANASPPAFSAGLGLSRYADLPVAHLKFRF